MPSKAEVIERIRSRPVVIDAHTHVGADPACYQTGAFPYCMSVEDQVLRARAGGVDHVVAFPFIYSEYFSLHAFRKGVFRRDPRSLSRHPYGTENAMLMREIYDAFPQYAGTVLPFATFDPGRRQAEQARGLEDLAARYPLFGIKTATSYLQSRVTDVLGRGAPLLDFAARHNVPATIHCAVIPGDPWANVFEVLKVVRARPDVRFCIAHTCRFDRRALDAAAEMENCFVDFSAFHIHCRLALDDHPGVAAPADRFPADYGDHAAAMHKIAEHYPDKMIWGTDTPAHYFMGVFYDDSGKEHRINLPCGPETEAAELRKLPEAVRRRITYTNTMRYLFGG
jgi:predicted TIM-barrel fold metal-dependent hydrolase